MGKKYIIIMVMCATRTEAGKIAGNVLKKRLAACANIISGVESRFWWKGQIDKASEVLLMMKTKRADFKMIEKEIKMLHSYEVPEIIALPILEGISEYLNWININTK